MVICPRASSLIVLPIGGRRSAVKGIPWSSTRALDEAGVFQYPADTESRSSAGQSIDVPNIFRWAGESSGKQATIIPRKATVHESSDLHAVPEDGSWSSTLSLNSVLTRIPERTIILRERSN